MVVGVDVHKQSHAVALLDERGTSLGSLSIPNSVAGAERLLAWLDEHDAPQAPVGIENAAGYGRLLCAVLASAGCEVLNVPAWRTHRDRHEQGRGKSDPGDALAIAQVVLRKRAELGPALEPELIRALAAARGPAAPIRLRSHAGDPAAAGNLDAARPRGRGAGRPLPAPTRASRAGRAEDRGDPRRPSRRRC